jgi:hypothetical protein
MGQYVCGYHATLLQHAAQNHQNSEILKHGSATI